MFLSYATSNTNASYSVQTHACQQTPPPSLRVYRWAFMFAEDEALVPLAACRRECVLSGVIGVPRHNADVLPAVR